jgi:hypothetical protein
VELYAVVRAHGLKSRLLRRNDYEAIAGGEKGLYEYPDYSAVSDRDALEEKVEKVYRVYVRRVSLLASLTPELSPLLNALLDRLEFENSKIQLRRLVGGGAHALFYPYGRHIGPSRLSALRSWEEVWGALSEAGLVETPAPEEKSLAGWELALDLAYCRHLLRGVEGSKVSRRSKRALERAALTECSIALSRWSRALGADAVLEAVSGVGLSGVCELLRGVAAKSWSAAEADRLLASEVAKPLEEEYPLEAPFLYAFEIYARLEARNLEKVLTGLHLGLSSGDALKFCAIAL